MKFGIVMATKDYPYVQDFIDEHLKIGIDRIVIYDGSEKTHEFNHPNVIIRRWDKPHVAGCAQYNEYVKEFGHETDFMTAFLDEDEIINTKGLDIHAAMQPYEGWDSLALNWRVFGGRVDEGNTSVKMVEKYLYHAPEDTKDPNGYNYIKSIVRNNAIVNITDPHFPNLKPGKVNKGVNGNIVVGSITPVVDVVSSIWIDHFHFQERERYIWSRTRYIEGRVTRSREEVASLYDSCQPLCNKKRVDV